MYGRGGVHRNRRHERDRSRWYHGQGRQRDRAAGSSATGASGSVGTGTAGTSATGAAGTSATGTGGRTTGAAGVGSGAAGTGPTGAAGAPGARGLTGGCSCSVPLHGSQAIAGVWLLAAAGLFARRRGSRR